MEQKTYTLNDGRVINIHPLHPDDKTRLVEFYDSLSKESLRWIKPPSKQDIDEKFRYPDYYIALLTTHDSHVAGYGEILKDPRMENGELNIHIHQDYQGVGLGTAMMIILVKEATEEQLHSINLRVAAGNTRAIQLFHKCGFQEVMHEESGKLEDTVYMIKRLKK